VKKLKYGERKMPHETVRKIVKVGGSLAVTIPKPWLRYFKLKESDEVRVVSDGSIIIEPLPKKRDNNGS
jgi:antitoxin component of MazEF toxin-antitoxin module